MSARSVLFQIRYMPLAVRDCLFFKLKGVAWHRSWRLWGLPCILRRRGGILRIGRNFVACSLARFNEIGVSQPVFLSVARRAELLIGDDVGISGASVAAAMSVRIGNRVMIGAGCLITDTDSHALHPEDRRSGDRSKIVAKPIVIEDDVFIGARAIILKGVRLGRGCVVGAGSVVTRDVPPMTVAAGNPAKVVAQLDRTKGRTSE